MSVMREMIPCTVPPPLQAGSAEINPGCCYTQHCARCQCPCSEPEPGQSHGLTPELRRELHRSTSVIPTPAPGKSRYPQVHRGEGRGHLQRKGGDSSRRGELVEGSASARVNGRGMGPSSERGRQWRESVSRLGSAIGREQDSVGASESPEADGMGTGTAA